MTTRANKHDPHSVYMTLNYSKFCEPKQVLGLLVKSGHTRLRVICSGVGRCFWIGGVEKEVAK